MNLVKIINSPLLRLSTAERYSGIYLARKDTVSDHTTQVGLISLLLANDLTMRDQKVDLGSVALKALTHDIDESITCDVPRNVKYYNDSIRTSLDEISEASVKKIANIHNFPQLFTLWETSKDKSLEGFIVKIADMLHVIVKLREELVLLGNMHMLKVLVEIDGHLSKLFKYINSEEFIYGPIAKEYFFSLVDQSLNVTRELRTSYGGTLQQFDVTNQQLFSGL